MKTLNYRIRLEKEEEGGYTVIVPALTGCVTFGETVEEAIDMATSQSYGGSGTVRVELFKDGTYRVLPDVGNLYNSPGLLVAVSPLSEDHVGDTVYTKVEDEI